MRGVMGLVRSKVQSRNREQQRTSYCSDVSCHRLKPNTQYSPIIMRWSPCDQQQLEARRMVPPTNVNAADTSPKLTPRLIDPRQSVLIG